MKASLSRSALISPSSPSFNRSFLRGTVMPLAFFVALASVQLGATESNAQASQWTGNSNNFWQNGLNWDLGNVPNAANEWAQFGSSVDSRLRNQIGINGSSGLTAGAIEKLGDRPYDQTIYASGTAGATASLTLAGVTVDGVANTILRNNSSSILSILPNIGQAGANVLTISLGNPIENVVNISNSGAIDVGVAITGTARNLTLLTSSTAPLNGFLRFSGSAANTYTGLTAVEQGRLELKKTAGVTAVAGDLKIGTGTVSNTHSAEVNLGASNQIANTSAVELAGGVLYMNGFSEGAAGVTGVGALTLTANSTIDFGSFGAIDSVIQFAGVGMHTAGALLQVTNWSGNTAGGGSGDRLLFAGVSDEFRMVYGQSEVLFNGASGYGFMDYGSYYEIFGMTPVPEPSTWAAGFLTVAALGYTQRKRIFKRRASASVA
jgi:autotransporter-associated beta strand protein